MYVFGIWASDNDSRELRYALCQVSFSRQYRTGQVWEAAAGQYAPPAVGLAGIKHELATQRLSRSTSAPPSAWLGPASWCKMVLLASGFAQSPTVLPRGQTSRSCRGLARVLTKIWSIKCLLSWNGKLPSFLLLKTDRSSRPGSSRGGPTWEKGETTLEICVTQCPARHVPALLEAEEGSTKYCRRNKQQFALFRAKYWNIFSLVIKENILLED